MSGTTPKAALRVRVAQVVGIGLVSGIGFVLPMLVMLRTAPGQARTVKLMFALLVAVLLIRRLGRILHGLLDRTAQPRRFPLLALYAVAAMVAPISLLLLPSQGR